MITLNQKKDMQTISSIIQIIQISTVNPRLLLAAGASLRLDLCWIRLQPISYFEYSMLVKFSGGGICPASRQGVILMNF